MSIEPRKLPKALSSPPLPAWKRSILLLLPPPKSKLDYWEDDESISVTWTPSFLARLLGERPFIGLFRKIDGDLWIDAETGRVVNRWLRARLEEFALEQKRRRTS